MRGFLVRVLLWLLLRTTFEELMRAQRGPPEQRARRIYFGLFLLTFVVFVGGFMPYVLWLVTGRGPYRWLGASRHIAINGRRRVCPPIPEDATAALASGWAFPGPIPAREDGAPDWPD